MTKRRKKSPQDGPLREVVYIFEREGDQGGGIWWLVLECGHSVARKRFIAKSLTQVARMMFRPLEATLAPKRCQCLYCGSGHPPQDPALLIKAFGGEVP